MRAAFISAHGGPEVLQVGILPKPTPGPGEVRVQVAAAALNHLDLWVRGGLPGLKLNFPHVLGGDASGVVDAVGAGVTGVDVGEKVIVHPGLSCGHCPQCLGGWESLCPHYRILGEHVSGTHAEWVCVPRANVFKKPECLSFGESASIGLVFTTAWQMLVRRARVRRGDRVVIHAVGSGVGSAAIQIARAMGAEVLATSSSAEKRALAQQLGATHVLDYSLADWPKALKKLWPDGADIIVDHLGDKHWESNIRALRMGGTLVTCGATTGFEAKTDLRHVFYRQLSILGSTMGTKADFPRILGEFETGAFRPVIDSTFSLEHAGQAFARLQDRLVFGKVVIEVSRDTDVSD